MRLLSQPSLRQASGPSPLRTKLLWSGCLVIGILSAALLLCMSALLYNTSYTANMLNTNHLHSSALQQLDILCDAAEAFRAYPDAETRGKLELAFDEMDSLLLQFEDSQLPENSVRLFTPSCKLIAAIKRKSVNCIFSRTKIWEAKLFSCSFMQPKRPAHILTPISSS